MLLCSTSRSSNLRFCAPRPLHRPDSLILLTDVTADARRRGPFSAHFSREVIEATKDGHLTWSWYSNISCYQSEKTKKPPYNSDFGDSIFSGSSIQIFFYFEGLRRFPFIDTNPTTMRLQNLKFQLFRRLRERRLLYMVGSNDYEQNWLLIESCCGV